MNQSFQSCLEIGQSHAGFVLRKKSRVKCVEIDFFEFEHEKTGAKYIHLGNSDDNNVFAVAFRTTPTDSTGVAHILEHIALAGSKHYPVRDPFFSMRNRSLKTFMNAFTASDWTMYPFATQNLKDFYNLLAIYLDAAFFPLITKNSFLQEGCRLEFEKDKDGKEKLTFKGVVFNEMKGAMSVQQYLMYQGVSSALFPTITYGKNSGGDPKDIPELRWEDLKAFHARHYHPSNAWFYSYGSFPVHDHLSRVDERILSHFEKIDPQTDVPDEQRFEHPQTFEFSYPAGEGEDELDSHQIALSWLTCPITNDLDTLSLSILNEILLGNSAAPLRKALLESKLGKSLADTTGYEDGCRESFFSAGLQGVRKRDLDKVENLILETLEGIRNNGIDQSLVDSAIHQFELSMKEITGRSYPYGLSLLLNNFDRWMHGGSFEDGMEFDTVIGKIKTAISQDRFFEGLIEKYLLNNPHRVRVVLKPDGDYNQRQESYLQNLLDKKEAALSAEDTERIKSEAAQLEASQSEKEDLSVLPKVEVSDVPKNAKFFPPKKENARQLLFYEQPTNGILYLNLRASLSRVDKEIRPHLPFALNLLTSAGTGNLSYDQVSLLIAGNTGGVAFDTDADFHVQRREIDETFTVSGKALRHKSEKLFSIIGMLLNDWSFKDFDRIKTLVQQAAVAQKNSILHSGHSFAASLCKRKFNSLTRLSETYGGIEQVRYTQKLAAMSDSKLKDTIGTWSEIIPTLLDSAYGGLTLIGDRETLEEAEKYHAQLMELFPKKNPSPPTANQWGEQPFLREIWLMPASVAYVARSYKAPDFQHSDSAAMSAVSALLETKYIHREVREKGGAYGGNCGYNSEEGVFTFTSYRDPNLAETWKVYSDSIEWLLRGDFTDEEVEEAKLIIFSRIDKPLSPSGKAIQDLGRRLTGKTPEKIENFRQKLFSLNKSDLIEATQTWLTKEYSESAITGSEILDKNKNEPWIQNHETLRVFQSED